MKLLRDMRVKDLIERLQRVDPEAPVVFMSPDVGLSKHYFTHQVKDIEESDNLYPTVRIILY